MLHILIFSLSLFCFSIWMSVWLQEETNLTEIFRRSMLIWAFRLGIINHLLWEFMWYKQRFAQLFHVLCRTSTYVHTHTQTCTHLLTGMHQRHTHILTKFVASYFSVLKPVDNGNFASVTTWLTPFFFIGTFYLFCFTELSCLWWF